MNIFPISFIANKDEMTKPNVIKMLRNVKVGIHSNLNEIVWKNIMYIIKLAKYSDENPLDDLFLDLNIKDELLIIMNNIIKDSHTTNCPIDYIEELHNINLDFLIVNSTNKHIGLYNIIDFNTSRWSIDLLSKKDFSKIDLKMMTGLYFYYMNSSGVGYKIGSEKNKKSVRDLVTYYQENKPEEFNIFLKLEYVPLDTVNILCSKSSSHHEFVIKGLFEDFGGEKYFYKLLDSFFYRDCDKSYFLKIFETDEVYLNNVFKYIVNHYKEDKPLNSNHIKVSYELFKIFENYISNEIFEEMEKTLNDIVKSLIENKEKNKNIRVMLFVLERAALISYDSFKTIIDNYNLIVWHTKKNSFNDTTKKLIKNNPSNAFLQIILKNINLFELAEIYNNFKEKVKLSTRQSDYLDYITESNLFINQLLLKSLVTKFLNNSKEVFKSEKDFISCSYIVMDFLKKENPNIEEFEVLFYAINLNPHSELKSGRTIDMNYNSVESKNYERTFDNNIFTFISQYIRGEPEHIIIYFSDVLKVALDDTIDSENEFVIYLKQYKKLIPQKYLEKAKYSALELEEFLMRKLIPVNNIKVKKNKF